MFNRRAIFAAIAIAASASFAAPVFADALSDISSRGTIRVAVPQDFPPFGSVGTDMAPQGYDIDVANLIGEKLGVKVELVPVPSANRVPYLQTNKVDLVISSLGKNQARRPAKGKNEQSQYTCSIPIVSVSPPRMAAATPPRPKFKP